MNPAGLVVQSAAFVTSGAGLRFRMVSEPADRRVCGTVVLVHAFAEEMNKSRRMAARMARLLAGDGWRVVQRDLCGCGDSSGDFGDATWADWAQDVDEELAMAEPHGPIWLWCERAGALLATAALAVHSGVNVLLWQPVMSGAQHLQQFLRLHAGARIVGSAKDDASSSPIERLRSGVAVELGGYPLNPALAMGLEQASFDLPATFEGRVVWFEVSADESPTLSPQGVRVAQRLRERGIAIEAEALSGPPFWQTQEIEECEALLERTRALLSDHAASNPTAASRVDMGRAVAHDISS